MAIGFHSVVIDVADLEAGVRDFARLLGVAPVANPDPSRGERGATFVLANMRLELRGSIDGWATHGREGIAALRFSRDPSPGSAEPLGWIASPTVPIEFVAAPIGPNAIPSIPTGDATAHVQGLDHVVVATRDPERARRFFGDELGIRLALDRSFPERNLRLLFFRLGGITIEVASILGESSPDPGEDVFHGLAWTVSRIDALHARLCDGGVGVSEIRAGHKPGTRVCSLREPVHGVPTLLIEHPPREDW